MDVMQDLLFMQGYLLDEISDLFPGGVTLGIGASSFIDTPLGEPDAPVIITKSLGAAHNEERESELVDRISRVVGSTTREHCSFDADKDPAVAMIVAQKGVNRGVVVISVAARQHFKPEECGVDADEFMQQLKETVGFAAPISHVYGRLFY